MTLRLAIAALIVGGALAGDQRVARRVEVPEAVDGLVGVGLGGVVDRQPVAGLALDVGQGRAHGSGVELGVDRLVDAVGSRGRRGCGSRCSPSVRVRSFVRSRAMSGPTALDIGDRARGDELVLRPVVPGDRHVVDLLGARVGGEVLDVRVDVPVDAARVVGAAEAVRSQDEGDRIARDRLVGSIAVVEDELDRASVGHERGDVVALEAGGARRAAGGCGRVAGWASGKVPVRICDELAGPVDLGLDPAGDPGLGVAFDAGDVRGAPTCS